MKHAPELGSNQGLSQFDTEVSQPTLADEDQERQETEAVLATFKSAVGQQKQKEVAQDLEIVIRKVELQFRELDFSACPQGGFSECQPDGLQRAASPAGRADPFGTAARGRGSHPQVCRAGTWATSR